MSNLFSNRDESTLAVKGIKNFPQIKFKNKFAEQKGNFPKKNSNFLGVRNMGSTLDTISRGSIGSRQFASTRKDSTSKFRESEIVQKNEIDQFFLYKNPKGIKSLNQLGKNSNSGILSNPKKSTSLTKIKKKPKFFSSKPQFEKLTGRQIEEEVKCLEEEIAESEQSEQSDILLLDGSIGFSSFENLSGEVLVKLDELSFKVGIEVCESEVDQLIYEYFSEVEDYGRREFREACFKGLGKKPRVSDFLKFRTLERRVLDLIEE
jgi:hypothetical protein